MIHSMHVFQTQPFWHHDGMMGMHWGWWLLWLVILVGAAWAITAAFRSQGGEGPGGSAGRSPDDLLRERYARGEISEEELQEGLRTIRESRAD